MEPFKKKFEVIWANLDPNAHLRHTAYNDYAAQVRVNLFEELGFPLNELVASGFGPILFHEDTSFIKEVFMNEVITVDCAVLAFREDMKVWKFRQQVFKEDGQMACAIIATGAFMDLKLRRVVMPPKEIINMLDRIPAASDFYTFKKSKP